MDSDKQTAEALTKYKEGLALLASAVECQQNPHHRASLHSKMAEYLDRAEQLKQALARGTAAVPKHRTEVRALLAHVVVVEQPDVMWDDIVGLETAKRALSEAVIPFTFPHWFKDGAASWDGILLYGPPGVGKTALARAVATHARVKNFMSVSCSDLVTKYVGESAHLVAELFQWASELKPSIIFIDEIDSLGQDRSSLDNSSEAARHIKTELLVRMQRLSGVLVLAATNLPWSLDPALRRRFERRIYVGLPLADARATILEKNVGCRDHTLTAADFRELAEQTEGFSGADIAVLAKDALLAPIRRILSEGTATQWMDPEFSTSIVLTPVTRGDVNQALVNTSATVGSSELVKFEEFTKQFGMR